MTKGLKALVGVVLVFSLLFSGVGYATLTDSLSITGSASAEAPAGVNIYEIGSSAGLTNIVYSGTVITADVSFDANGKAIIYINVRNNADDAYMYYGINYFTDVDDNANFAYTAETTDPSKVETGVTGDFDGSRYIAAVDYDHPGAQIASGATHDGLLVTLSQMGSAKTGKITLSLEYKDKDEYKPRTQYTVSFMDGTTPINVTYNGTETSVITLPIGTGLDLSGIEPVDSDIAKAFDVWKDAQGNTVTSIPADNMVDYVLYTSWTQLPEITFVDADPNDASKEVEVYSEYFMPGEGTTLSQTGLKTIQKYLDEVNKNATDDMQAIWPSYDLTKAEDIKVKLTWTYTGVANIEPVYDNGNHVAYKVTALGDMGDTVNVVVPEYINGLPVIELSNGAFSDFDDLTNVYLPKTITTIGEDAFANYEETWKLIVTQFIKRETVQIYYEGTLDQWLAVEKHENWDRYLGHGSIVVCQGGDTEVTLTLNVAQSNRLGATVNDTLTWRDSNGNVVE